VITDTMRAHGVATAYVSDNPVLQTPRFPDLRTTTASLTPPATTPGVESDLLVQLDRLSAATAAHYKLGIQTLRELSKTGKRFFLGVDPFLPEDAFEAPRVYVEPSKIEKLGLGPMDGRLTPLHFKGDDLKKVRDRYRKHVETVDEWVGRLIDALHDLDLAGDTAVAAIGDHGMSLGEHGYLGRATPTSHRNSYEIPLLLRHPKRQLGGDDIDWYASTHDVAPTLLSFMRIPVPGKMLGEDLTALYDGVDQWDLFNRPRSITAVGSQIVVRDNRWLMVADRERIQRRLYDDDEEADDDIKRYDDVANDEPGVLSDLSETATTVAGGTLPEFGPDGAVRPKVEHGDDDVDDDGIPNDFDPVNNDEIPDGTSRKELQFDGRKP
jgi:arylsulfatase A-like enzyme